MIKLKNILSEQKDLYTYTYPNDTMYKYAVKNGAWWAKNVQTGKEFDLSQDVKFKSSIDKLDKQYPKARAQKSSNDTEKVITAVRRNKNGWIIPPTTKTDQTIKTKSLGADTQKSFETLKAEANANLRSQLVGKTIAIQNTGKMVPGFTETWSQYDLNAFNQSGWPTDADYTSFKPATLSGQKIRDVYVLMSWQNSGMETVNTKFQCSMVYVGYGEKTIWVPTSYIDVV